MCSRSSQSNMEMKNNDTPRPMYDLNEERGKASFHPRALTFVLEGGEAKTQRREYFERLVEEVEIVTHHRAPTLVPFVCSSNDPMARGGA